MRASFILLGPLLARFGRVIISNPGGDRIGRRPVNLHVDAMRALGAEIDYRNGYYYAQAPGRLRGGEVRFPQVTVMGTENAMLAATLADGHTVIRPAAQEPEVDDLIAFLRQDGRRRRADRPRHDRGPRAAAPARGRPHRDPRPDRDRDVPRRGRRHRRQAHPRERGLRPRRRAGRGDGRVGVPVACGQDLDRDRRDRPAPGDLRACDIETAPYPGLATDVQPPTCVLLTQASGTSRVHEAVFEDRHRVAGRAAQAGRAHRHRGRPPRRRSTARRGSTAPRRPSATCAPARRSSSPPSPRTVRRSSTARTTCTAGMRTSTASSSSSERASPGRPTRA